MAIPSKRWFPQNLPARAAWFQNFSEKFSDVATSLGFSAADVTMVEQDNQVMQFLARAAVQLDTYNRAVGKFLKIITEGDPGSSTPMFPANPNFALPVVQPTGIYARLVNLIERIKLAKGYTDEIGALLGILPTASDSISPEEVKPTIEAFAALEDYIFSVVVSNRAKADSWEVAILREGATEWQTVKTATGKSVDVEVRPTAEGKPERIQVRVQLIKNNEKYGQPSDPTYVTLNP